jgi:hypothetical protein
MRIDNNNSNIRRVGTDNRGSLDAIIVTAVSDLGNNYL